MRTTELGRKIVELRTGKGLSQEELAALCHMNVRSIQRIEAGTVNPRAYTLKLLSRALDYQFALSGHCRNGKFSFKELFYQVIDQITGFYYKKGDENMRERNILQDLKKSSKGKQIAGICAGLGENTTIPDWFWRILFIFSAFIYGIGVLIYGLLWMFMPQAVEDVAEIAVKKQNWLQQLSKSTKDKKIAGVCGGLGENSTIPSWFWRIIFVIATLVYGAGLVFYLLMWIFVPSSETKDSQNLSLNAVEA